MYIGKNIIISPNKTAKLAIQNQEPFVYIQQIASSRQSARYEDNGSISNLCFLISFGRFVKVNAKINAESTIQNHESVLLIARLQIKQGNNARA
jgi:hypothetical protein